MTSSEQPHWRGINHLALITTDMDATVRFYHGVLGARLVATIGTPGFRHYFFEFGPEQTVAFFEYKGVELEQWAKPAGIPDPQRDPVRPPVVQPARRARPRIAAATVEGTRL